MKAYSEENRYFKTQDVEEEEEERNVEEESRIDRFSSDSKYE